MKLINTYTEASGLKINIIKYEVFFSRNIRNSIKEDLASIMGVHHVMGTRKYLGLSSMIRRSKKVTYQGSYGRKLIHGKVCRYQKQGKRS